MTDNTLTCGCCLRVFDRREDVTDINLGRVIGFENLNQEGTIYLPYTMRMPNAGPKTMERMLITCQNCWGEDGLAVKSEHLSKITMR